VGFGSTTEFVASSPPALPHRHVRRSGPERSGSAGSASPGFASPSNATTSGAPYAAPVAEPPLRWTKDCRAFAGAVLRVLAPLDGSGTPRRFAALFHAARVPGDALQSFPLSRSRTRSRGPVLPCGFAFDRRRRDEQRASSVLSPWRRPFAAAGPKARRTHGPGSRFPAPPGKVRRARRSASTAASPRSSSSGSPVNGRHAHFEALLPSGVRSRGDPRPGQGEVVGSVLSWAYFPFRVCSNLNLGFGISR